MIRTVIICQEEPFFIPKQVGTILERSGASYRVVGGSVLSPSRKGRGLQHWLKERSRIYSKQELLAVFFAYAYTKLVNGLKRLFGAASPYSVKSRFEAYQVPLLSTSDIDDPVFLEKLRDLEPDVIVSISCPQQFSKELLQIPTRYCLNLHATLLPRHRGVFGTWWTLFEGDEEAGGSIHTMEERLDAGELLWQEAFKVKASDTQFAIAEKSKRRMAEGLVDLLEKIDRKAETPLSPTHTPSYNRAPSKEKGREFHRRGKKILRLADLRRALRPKFVTRGGDKRS